MLLLRSPYNTQDNTPSRTITHPLGRHHTRSDDITPPRTITHPLGRTSRGECKNAERYQHNTSTERSLAEIFSKAIVLVGHANTPPLLWRKSAQKFSTGGVLACVLHGVLIGAEIYSFRLSHGTRQLLRISYFGYVSLETLGY